MRILITGGFDPIHSGHLRALGAASRLGEVYVGLNSDNYLITKKGSFLLPFSERKTVIQSIRYVTNALNPWDDSDGSSVEAIKLFWAQLKSTGDVLAFVNGGDRTPECCNAAEVALCEKLGILNIFGVGGGKTASSTNFLRDYVNRVSKPD